MSAARRYLSPPRGEGRTLLVLDTVTGSVADRLYTPRGESGLRCARKVARLPALAEPPDWWFQGAILRPRWLGCRRMAGIAASHRGHCSRWRS